MCTITVCMIVKNEAAVLSRCLDSIQGVYDELIIVDTGSSDNTKEIAHRYTNEVYDFEWIDDFAAARNYAFSKAHMEYIYSVDADEMLTPDHRMQMLQLKEMLLPEIEIVQMWYITPAEYNTTENYEKDLRPKWYKRLREFCWIDPVHESVRLDPVVYNSDIEILHLPQSMHAKRDLDIFSRYLADNQVLSHKLHYMYARELLIAGEREDYACAEEYFQRIYEDEQQDDEMRSEALCILLRIKRVLAGNEAFLQLAEAGAKKWPCSELFTELGIFYYERADIVTARKCFEKAMKEVQPMIYLAAQQEIPRKYLRMGGNDEESNIDAVF